MANLPSKRTHRMKPMEGLNLTPFIDMITCLMFFLLMFAGIIPVVIIDAPLPKIASTAEEVKKAQDDKNKLELTIFINSANVVVKAGALGEKAFPKAQDGGYPMTEVHTFLVTLKGKKPDSTEVTLMPADDSSYDTMIQVMDASRELVQGDPGYRPVPAEISAKPESGQFNRLFPDISIGGV